jgi:hypothetical protein
MATRELVMSGDHGFTPHGWRHLGQRLVRRLREAHAAQVELYERMTLRQEPWREEFLHWSYDGVEWHLHGRYPAPVHDRRPSVTRSGWCPRVTPRVTAS